MPKTARIAIGIVGILVAAVFGPWLVAALLMLRIGRFDSHGLQIFLLAAS